MELLKPEAVTEALKELKGWSLDGKAIKKQFTFRDFPEAVLFVSALVPGEYYVAAVNEEGLGEEHDPAVLEALIRIAHQVRVVDGERRRVDLTTAVVR